MSDKTLNDKASKPNIHEGHRERMREKLLTFGQESLRDHELLEVLLFYSIPRANTNEIAHELINKFGSLKDVVFADINELMKIKGCKMHSALLIKLVGSIFLRISKPVIKPKQKFDNLSSVGDHLTKYFMGKKEEHFCVMLFNNAMQLIDLCELSRGSVNSASVDPRSVARVALEKNATVAIIAHNHPSGNTLPGMADREITNRVDAALTAIGIFLLDHIIVSDAVYTPTMTHRFGQGSFSLGSPHIDDKIIKKFYST